MAIISSKQISTEMKLNLEILKNYLFDWLKMLLENHNGSNENMYLSGLLENEVFINTKQSCLWVQVHEYYEGDNKLPDQPSIARPFICGVETRVLDEPESVRFIKDWSVDKNNWVLGISDCRKSRLIQAIPINGDILERHIAQ